MTSTPHGSEEPCQFGDLMYCVLLRIYSLWCHYGPTVDIIIHANDIKSAFHQLNHPNSMRVFLYIIVDKLFLSCGQPFGTDFSPANWEVVQQYWNTSLCNSSTANFSAPNIGLSSTNSRGIIHS
jgi:hypothetical protein